MQSYFRNVVRFHGENKKIRIEIFLPHRAQALITHGPIGAGGLAQSCGGVRSMAGMYGTGNYHTIRASQMVMGSDGMGILTKKKH